jgi:hypothetical protein
MLKCRAKVKPPQAKRSQTTVTCPYDTTHVIDINDIQEHIEKVCETRPKDQPPQPYVHRRPFKHPAVHQRRKSVSAREPEKKQRQRERSVDAVFVTEERKEFK